MNITSVRLVVVAGAALFLAVSPGCRKKGAELDAMVSASKLPGAADVMPLIEKKDYDGALAALMKVRDSATNEDQNSEYVLLARQARDRLTELGATDEKAMGAAHTLRLMQSGR